MRAIGTGTQACLLGSALLFSSPALVCAAEVHHSRGHNVAPVNHVHYVSARYTATYHAGHRHGGYTISVARTRRRRSYAGRSYGISCVPYAREVSGIMVAGNAWQWWQNAAGQYARGDQPEAGSVLNFRANSRMPLGHVAVVSHVINAREIVVDQANWGGYGMRGGVSHNVAIVDVSEANNWSAGAGRSRPRRRVRIGLPDLRIYLQPAGQRYGHGEHQPAGAAARHQPRPVRPAACRGTRLAHF